MNLHQILLTHRYQPPTFTWFFPLRSMHLFAEKLIHVFFFFNFWSHNVNTIPGSVPLCGTPPTVSGVRSGPRAILHPSFRKICSVISVWSCWQSQTNRQTNMGENITSLADVMEKHCPSAKNKEQANKLMWITRMKDTNGLCWQIFPCHTRRCLKERTLCKTFFVKCMFCTMRWTRPISNLGVISVVSV